MNTLRALVCLLTMSLAHSLAAAAPSAQEIVAASDAVRNPAKPFSMTTTLVEYRNGKETASSTVTSYAKADKASGSYLNLLRFVAPARDADKLMLKAGNDLWVYDPASKASVRVSPQQRLLGQAANGDILTVNLSKDYRAALVGQEELQDGERQKRQAHRLLLEAAVEGVTYPRIEMWVEVATSRPIKARFFAESGSLLKTAFYRRYQPQLGGERPTETVIIDGLDPNWVTVMRYADYAYRDIPDAWMQRDFLPRFKPD